MKDGYKDVDEILLEVAEEEGMTKTEIRDLWKHQRSYVIKQMTTPEIYAIHIPFIGTISLNIKQFKTERKGRNYIHYSDFMDKGRELMNKDDFKKYGNAHKKTSSIHKLINYILKKFETGVEYEEVRNRHHKMWDVIAKYSNGKYNKKEE